MYDFLISSASFICNKLAGIIINLKDLNNFYLKFLTELPPIDLKFRIMTKVCLII